MKAFLQDQDLREAQRRAREEQQKTLEQQNRAQYEKDRDLQKMKFPWVNISRFEFS